MLYLKREIVMNERDTSEQFHRAWEAKKQGVKSEQEDLPDPVIYALETADHLARVDYSNESQVRDSLRQQILLTENFGKPVKKPVSRLVWGSLSFAAGATFLILMIAGLAWAIRNLIPPQGPAGSQLAQQSAPDSETGVIGSPFVTPTPMPVAALPTATMDSTRPPVNGISYVVQEGDTLLEIAY
jgi:hypothetical protein